MINSAAFMFQFLIGTVKTFPISTFLSSPFQVSIPHRYCKNGWFPEPDPETEGVSIPHRYCKNAMKRRKTRYMMLSFNSS